MIMVSLSQKKNHVYQHILLHPGFSEAIHASIVQGLIDSMVFNSLPKDKILDQSILKDLADDKINVTYLTNFVPAFYPFSHYVFKKASL